MPELYFRWPCSYCDYHSIINTFLCQNRQHIPCMKYSLSNCKICANYMQFNFVHGNVSYAQLYENIINIS